MLAKLRAVLGCAVSDYAQCLSLSDFQKNFKADSAQCYPEWSLTPRSVSLRRVRIHAVFVCFESDSAQC